MCDEECLFQTPNISSWHPSSKCCRNCLHHKSLKTFCFCLFVCSQQAVSKIVTIQTTQIISGCISFIPLTVQIKPKLLEDVPLVEFMYLVFTSMPDESYHKWLKFLLLCLCGSFQVLISSLVYWFKITSFKNNFDF